MRRSGPFSFLALQMKRKSLLCRMKQFERNGESYFVTLEIFLKHIGQCRSMNTRFLANISNHSLFIERSIVYISLIALWSNMYDLLISFFFLFTTKQSIVENQIFDRQLSHKASKASGTWSRSIEFFPGGNWAILLFDWVTLFNHKRNDVLSSFGS